MARVKETEVGAWVRRWFEQGGFTVYEEVRTGVGIADLVGVQGHLIVIVECKASPSMELLQQLIRWRNHGHLIYGATPSVRSEAFKTLCEELEVGWLCGSPLETHRFVESKFHHPKAAKLLRQALNSAQADGSHARAGSNGGGVWAPWRDTVRAIQNAVRFGGPVRLRDAILSIPHHYRGKGAARSGFMLLLDRKLVPGVVLERRDREVWLVPV